MNRVFIIAAVVLIGLGGFLITKFGKARYEQGYNRCVIDAKAAVAGATEVLKDELQKDRSCSNIDYLLHANVWVYEDGDR